jgi:hypothetical protein
MMTYGNAKKLAAKKPKQHHGDDHAHRLLPVTLLCHKYHQ